MGETEVRLDGWCEGGLGQQRNDGGGSTSMRKKSNWRALVHVQLNEFHWPFLLGPVFFRTALPCSGGYHMEWGGMPLRDAVGVNCKKDTTTENQDTAIKYMG